jgi:hypothetical protein
MNVDDEILRDAPGLGLVRQGIADLERGIESAESWLVLMGRERLTHLGIPVDDRCCDGPPGHELYDVLSDRDRLGAHARYNALVGNLLSFLSAAEHATTRRR